MNLGLVENGHKMIDAQVRKDARLEETPSDF